MDWNEVEGDVKRLLTHEPIQYVTGTSWFYGMQFKVNWNVLIPRPETEELVQKAVEFGKNYFQRLLPLGTGQKVAEKMSKHYRILDIGTGSGCIAIALKKEFPEAEVHASDFSEIALNIAKQNAEKNDTEIIFIHDNILQSNITGKYDLIISNPPYVTEKEKKQMGKNVVEFEPHSALFVPDDDAMKFYNAISFFAKSHLHPAGRLLLEINEAYKDEVCSLLEKENFINIEPFKDINNKWRIVKAQKA